MSSETIFGLKLSHVGIPPPKEEPAKQPVRGKKERFPSLYLSGDQLPPFLAKAEKGQKVLVVCSASVASRTERDERDRDKELSIELEIHDMGGRAMPAKEPQDFTDEELKQATK